MTINIKPGVKHSTFKVPYLAEEGHQITYPNGHTLVFVPKQGDVFNLSTWVKTGSIHEDDANNGVSHFLEHLMFKGTKRFEPGVFDRKMESMGAIINAATWKDFTFYYVTGPKGGQNTHFLTALDMHADMLLHSTLPEGEVGPQYDPEDQNYSGPKRERSVVIEEIGMREDQPWTKVYNSVNRMMYPDSHPYQRDVIGTRKIIGHIPREKIMEYYKTWYAPTTMTTLVVGEFDLNTLIEEVEKAFNFDADSKAAALLEKVPQATNQKGPKFEHLKGDYQTTFFLMGFHGPKPSDLKESIAVDIVSYILGEGRSSRMTQELLEKPVVPVFNGLSCGQSTFKLGNVFMIQGNFTADKPEKPLEQVRAELEKLLATSPITEEELVRAKKKLKVQFAETSETAEGIAETLGESLTVTNDKASYTDYVDVLTQLDLKTVQSIAKKYLDPKDAYTAVLSPS